MHTTHKHTRTHTHARTQTHTNRHIRAHTHTHKTNLQCHPTVHPVPSADFQRRCPPGIWTHTSVHFRICSALVWAAQFAGTVWAMGVWMFVCVGVCAFARVCVCMCVCVCVCVLVCTHHQHTYGPPCCLPHALTRTHTHTHTHTHTQHTS